jgi:hypothetical protein
MLPSFMMTTKMNLANIFVNGIMSSYSKKAAMLKFVERFSLSSHLQKTWFINSLWINYFFAAYNNFINLFVKSICIGKGLSNRIINSLNLFEKNSQIVQNMIKNLN